MPLIVISILLQVALVLHIVKTGRNTTWIWIVVMLPLAGSIAYFIIEVLPDLMAGKTGRSVSRTISKTINPNQALKQVVNDYAIADTTENSKKLAEEYLDQKMYVEARALYQKCLHGIHLTDPYLMHGLAKAEFALGKFEAACDTLDELIRYNPDFKNQDAHLLYAQVQEALGNTEAALHEYEVLHGYYVGPEASYRYALLSRKQGNLELANEVLAGIVATGERAGKHYSSQHKHWLKLAADELNS